MAWAADEDGNLQPTYEAEQATEERAIRTAKTLAGHHTAVIAWVRDTRPQIGEYGEPAELFRHGPVPDIK
ncbi:MAG: hypothetical protein IH582_02570 [Afipia sp.]|nr:hypothetical protein [Afipia sp.]